MLIAMNFPVITLVFVSHFVAEIWSECGYAEDSGWFHDGGSTCYFLSDSPSGGFVKAREECQAKGADLASMPDEMAWNFTVSIAESNKYWIGLWISSPPSNPDVNGRRSAGWTWLDQSTYNAEWNKWYDGEELEGTTQSAEPGTGESCVIFHKGYWFGNPDCDYPFRYICSKSFTPTTSETPTTINGTSPTSSDSKIPLIIGVVVPVVIVIIIVIVVVIVVIKLRKTREVERRRRENPPTGERGKSLALYKETIVDGDVVIKPLDLDNEA